MLAALALGHSLQCLVFDSEARRGRLATRRLEQFNMGIRYGRPMQMQMQMQIPHVPLHPSSPRAGRTRDACASMSALSGASVSHSSSVNVIAGDLQLYYVADVVVGE